MTVGHRYYIGSEFGVSISDEQFLEFNKEAIDWLRKEINAKVKFFSEPRHTFAEILQLLCEQQIEIPSYHRLSELITQSYLDYELQLLAVVKKYLSAAGEEKLKSLMLTEENRTASPLNQSHRRNLKAWSLNPRWNLNLRSHLKLLNGLKLTLESQ